MRTAARLRPLLRSHARGLACAPPPQVTHTPGEFRLGSAYMHYRKLDEAGTVLDCHAPSPLGPPVFCEGLELVSDAEDFAHGCANLSIGGAVHDFPIIAAAALGSTLLDLNHLGFEDWRRSRSVSSPLPKAPWVTLATSAWKDARSVLCSSCSSWVPTSSKSLVN